jgi:hypothetical protein
MYETIPFLTMPDAKYLPTEIGYHKKSVNSPMLLGP